MHYTVGQRRGLNLASSEPLYVVRLEANAKRVVVGPRSSLRTDVLQLKDVNWLGSTSLATVAREGLAIHARIRSTHTPVAAILVLDERGDSARVLLPEGEHGVSPGQACVFYADGAPDARILGGGWIARTHVAADDEMTMLNGALTAPSSQVGIAQ
jgi:tRNA-specific 2-thiouridylase